MRTVKIVFVLSFYWLYSCEQSVPRHQPNPAALELSKQVMTIGSVFDNPDSSRKAISLLDSAIKIDSDFFGAYYTKMVLLTNLRQFHDALLAANNLIRLKPRAEDLYITRASLYYQLGDSTSADNDCSKSLAISSVVLDTMSSNNSHYDQLSFDNGMALVMTGNQQKGNEILKQLYDRQTDTLFKQFYGRFLNKNKHQIMDALDSLSRGLYDAGGKDSYPQKLK